ncbi:MAG: hypothetical protein P1V97_33765 [Planctomycetota bacterium]|nr:hypothetical protein [Planctomycetota bacterium]
MFRKSSRELRPSELDFRQTIFQSSRYSTYLYGFALLKLKRFGEFNAFLAILKENKVTQKYYQLLGYRHFFTKNHQKLFDASEELKRTNPRKHPILKMRLQGQYLISKEQWEKYNKLKSDMQKRGGQWAKLIPVWDEMIAELKNR